MGKFTEKVFWLILFLFDKFWTVMNNQKKHRIKAFIYLYSYLQAIPEQIEINPFTNATCGVPRQDSWVILREPVGSDMPWPGFIFGQTPASIWYWCADQVSKN